MLGFDTQFIEAMNNFAKKLDRKEQKDKMVALSTDDLIKLCPTITFYSFGKPREGVPFKEFERVDLFFHGNAISIIEEAMKALGTRDLNFGMCDDQDKYWVQPKEDAKPYIDEDKNRDGTYEGLGINRSKTYRDRWHESPSWSKPRLDEPPPIIPALPELKAEPPAPVVIDKGFQLALQMIEELEVDNWEVIVRKLSELYIIKQQAGGDGK